jgi:hypothetical protein
LLNKDEFSNDPSLPFKVSRSLKSKSEGKLFKEFKKSKSRGRLLKSSESNPILKNGVLGKKDSNKFFDKKFEKVAKENTSPSPKMILQQSRNST